SVKMESQDPKTLVGDGSCPFAVEDYVQLACVLRRSARLSLKQCGVPVGGVVVNQGGLWTAWDEQGQGPEALKRLVGSHAVAQVEPLSVADIGPRSIKQDWQLLLLQAAVEQDHRWDKERQTVHLSDPDDDIGTALYWRAPVAVVSTFSRH